MCDIRCTKCEKKLMEMDGEMQGAVFYVDCPRCKKRNMIMPKAKSNDASGWREPVTIKKHTQHYLSLQSDRIFS